MLGLHHGGLLRFAWLLDPIRHWTDLPELIKALGHEPAWEPIPDSCWPERSRLAAPGTRAARIGQVGDLPWIGLTGAEAGTLARAAALILQRRGDPAAIAALDQDTGAVTLTVAFGSRPVLQFAPGLLDGATRESLDRLRQVHRDGRLATAAQVALALAGEGLGARFFAAFKHQLEHVAGAITGSLGPEDRRVLALLQLNRLLFLYFIQSRGWLDGRTDFLRGEVDRCLTRRGRLHQQLLRPLFFGTLNKRPEDRSAAARRLGQVPFLNGGLFEPHPLERVWRGSLPNPLLRDVFDELFERFHFTVLEGSTHAIAPDMLGRVFEGLMAPEDRSQSGSFYTPPNLVRSIIDQCLVALVAGRLGCDTDRAERMLAGQDRLVAPILRDITVLDPAAGSGAFLLGVLDRLVELRAGSTGEQRLRREILQKNLFGVDINPTAVRLTELRLWLAVIAADPADAAGSVHPLPNLDCLVRQGDSLADPLNLITRFPFRAGAMGATLARLRRSLVVATGDDKREAARRLRHGELQAMNECLDFAEHTTDRNIRECLGAARTTDLFGTPRGLDRMLRRELRECRAWRSRIRRARRKLTRDGEVPWFQYESHFADVFSAGGFDAVVGNPPWVRAEHLPLAVREHLAHRYRWWRSTPGPGAGFRHQPDLAVAFLERATELARPGGVVGMLLPAKLATAAYGASARHSLAHDFSLHAISDLGAGGSAEFDATVYPMALVARRSPPGPDHQVSIHYPGGTCRILQAVFGQGDQWVLQAQDAVEVARELAARYPTVKSHFSLHLGVKTGANQVFLDPPDTVEPDLLRRAIRGRDVRPFAITRGVTLLWPCTPDGAPLERLPPGARAYLEPFEPLLRSRTDCREGPWWSLFRTAPAASRYRVVWPDLARRLAAVALTRKLERACIPLNSCYLIAPGGEAPAHALAAWLNSTWIRALAKLAADPARGGYARFNARAVGGVPLPDSVLQDARLTAAGRRQDQDQIDELAAAHLQLSPAARKILGRVAGDGSNHRS
ncbi:MAG TPA: N-6 DNA methylase [Gemmatimonadales bacterium]|nr:N-6 DNA methylase [Gemmatimonadales bacterium]